MRIGIVTQHSFPESQDYRCRLIAETLTASGHSTFVFTPKVRGSVSPELDIVVRSGNARCSAPYPFSPYWTAWLVEQVRACGLDCLMSKQLRLAPCVIRAARRCGISSWLDLSENYPAMVASERAGERLVPVRRYVASTLEAYCTFRANLTTVVTEQNRRRLVALGVAPERLLVVSNTPLLAAVQHAKHGQRPDQCAARLNRNDKLQFVYAGLLSKSRGLDRLLHALVELKSTRKQLHLNIIGDGPEGAKLHQLCDRLDLNSAVTFHGWVSRHQLMERIAESDVGVIPHRINDFTNTTIPTKLFDYMACGLPLLTTDMAPCREVLDTTCCGWVCMDDVASLATALHEILSFSQPELTRIGEAGRRAIWKIYNWEMDGERMVKAIAAIDRRTPGPCKFLPDFC